MTRCVEPLDGNKLGGNPLVMRRTFVQSLTLGALSFGLFESSLFALAEDRPGKLATVREHPLSADERKQLQQSWDVGLQEQTKRLIAKPDDLQALSKRGDLHFFRGDFIDSLRDYEKMCEVDPAQEPGHWRLGLAQFYVGQFETSAKFFDRFFQTDDVDREGGLWKWLAQAKGAGSEKAREGLLKYTKFDREPMPTVYRLFEGTITPNELLKTVEDSKLSKTEREKRLFYIELYIGLWLDALKKPVEALPHFHAATANTWPRDAGYGPNWMWHVARVHFELLNRQAK